MDASTSSGVAYTPGVGAGVGTGRSTRSLSIESICPYGTTGGLGGSGLGSLALASSLRSISSALVRSTFCVGGGVGSTSGVGIGRERSVSTPMPSDLSSFSSSPSFE